jgi:hypothetical protein
MAALVPSFSRRMLQCHPQSPCAAALEIGVEVHVDADDVLVARYRIVGELSRLRIAVPGEPLDPERLWAHTCCEMFVARGGDEGYVEWNFSPTAQIARFDFSGYRQRRASPGATPARTQVTRSARELQLSARAPLPPPRGEPARVSLTAVIEDVDGALSYWALLHPRDQPDFHHPGGFVLALTP